MADIRIDTSSLTCTQFVIPGHSRNFMDGTDESIISLTPGVYDFEQISDQSTSFQFEVTSEGLVDYDLAHDGFLDGRETDTLRVRGFPVTIDATALSHDLLPLIAGVSVLKSDRPHELTLIPGAGYGFQPGSGIVADFAFDVNVDGTVTVKPRYAGVAQTSGATLTISGVRVTIDGRQLSHGLLPVSLLGDHIVPLSEGQTHEFTYIPAAGYGFQPASGIVADFAFDVNVDGTVTVKPRYGGVAQTAGQTLTIYGYRVIIDGQLLPYDLIPLLLGWWSIVTGLDP